ncbi:hypothetical protein F3Y22_tig00110044pilonHSYRG00340 [Hibiscus syriacus]|uniref:Uncharacterized protein n=1 Tax=Hibiscus syriacus TaxID=106335 RepID=A0A6A3BRY1_HIBSY|nr:hypothetical protein F3Y22_tig00110044pilonHSYRG00340 [Hibiscus syriacus]
MSSLDPEAPSDMATNSFLCCGNTLIILSQRAVSQEGELDDVAVVHSYEDAMPAGSHKTRLTALSVPPMGLFYPTLLIPDLYPPPPRSWFHDYEDMLEETWHIEFPRRSDMPDGLYPSGNAGLQMWDNYPFFPMKPKKEEKVGLAEAITSSILSTGRIDLHRKLFCSIQLIGGVALTGGLIPAVEERVLGLGQIPSSILALLTENALSASTVKW